MSDYSEVWEDMHEDQIKLDHKADQCKQALIDNLSSDEMIRIMFTSYLKTVSHNDIIKLHDNFIAADETSTDVDTDTLKLTVEMIRHLLRFRFTWDEIHQVFGYSEEAYSDAIKFLRDNELIDF